MKEKEHICGTCEYHRNYSAESEDWTCMNEYSDNYTDYTEYEDSCEDWEERAQMKLAFDWRGI